MAVVGHPHLLSFADHMDDLSARIQDVMQRYHNHTLELHAGGGLTGAAGMSNVTTGGEIFEAQARIQNRFQNLNTAVRQAAHGYTNTDQNSAQMIQQVGSGLKYT